MFVILICGSTVFQNSELNIENYVKSVIFQVYFVACYLYVSRLCISRIKNVCTLLYVLVVVILFSWCAISTHGGKLNC